ncbi:MAG: endonuclease/exonuclease/phosphatase family protein [Treponema sp.]|nr:endonuclease/exonuclease/phosphatase family protein [Treponema sp.]
MLILIKIILGFIAFALVGIAAFLLVLTLTEFRPPEREDLPITGSFSVPRFPMEQMLTICTWNIGYAALDADQDFFMDGGTGVRPKDKKTVEENLRIIDNFLEAGGADFIFLQEVDIHSRRSWEINEAEYLSKGKAAAFAANYRTLFVPVPIPDFYGKVDCGILTLGNYAPLSAERISLPVPYGWPVRLAQEKNCFLVERFPAGDAELVLVNLHLAAYDTGEGRLAQTRVLFDFLLAEYAKGNYCVAGGDFNRNFPGAEDNFPIKDRDYWDPVVLDPALLGEGWIFASDTSAPSCRRLNKPYNGISEENEYWVIDGFILSPNIELVDVVTVDLGFRNSDHNPVKIEFTIK